ncbi:MAG: tetratricopeptide repeat protein [Cyanobacteria bacterium P01_A01_bin.84]
MSRNTTTWVVSIPQSSGVEINAYLNVDNKPIRQQQKLKTLKEYIRKHPKGWKKRLELAQMLCIQGSWEEAIAQYSLVLKQQPQLINVQLTLGKILHCMGREEEAIKLYQKGLNSSNNLASQKHLQGLIEITNRKYHQAAIEFESAASLEPSNIAHWNALAKTQIALEAPHKALEALSAVSLNDSFEATNSTKFITQFIHTHDALLQLGDLEAAQKSLQQAYLLTPEDIQVLHRMADLRCRLKLVNGKPGKHTKQIIRDALKIAPKAAEVYNSLSYYYIFRGEWEQGISILEKFIAEHSYNPLGWYYYAICLFHTGKNRTAAEAILQAYKLYPQDCEIYRGLCEILPASGQVNLLPEIIHKMLNLFSDRWSVWTIAGKVLVENFQQTQKGCTLSAKAIELQPCLADTWFHHGRVLVLAGEYHLAIENLKQGWLKLSIADDCINSTSVSQISVDCCILNSDAIASIPQSIFAAFWLGKSYQQLNDNINSDRWWKIALNYSHQLSRFDATNAYYWQGRIFTELGNTKASYIAYQKACSGQLLYPARQDAELAISEYKK